MPPRWPSFYFHRSLSRSRSAHDTTGIHVALQALEISPQFGGALVSQVAAFLERLADYFLDLERQFGIQLNHGGRRTIHDRIMNDRGCGPTECLPACGHLVQHRPEA